MKLKHLAIPVIAGLAITQAFSQQEYEDAGRLTIEDPLTDYSEDYVNRENADWAIIRLDNATSSYTGHNVNVTNYYDQSYYGIYAYGSKYVNLSADEGTWNVITVYGGDYYQAGIGLVDMLETSTVSNTQIWMQGTPTLSSQTGIRAEGSSTRLVLDNVEIHTGMTSNDTTVSNNGITVQDGGTITNQGMRQVSVTSDLSNGGAALLAIYTGGGTIDLVDSTLTATGANPYSASTLLAINAPETSTISLTDSRISSANGNGLIGSVGSNLTVNLNNVNLENAQNQQILADVTTNGDINDSLLHLNLSNGTAFDGSAAVLDGAIHHSVINIDISSGASWNVTQHSVLGDISQGFGSLALDGSSIISFEELGAGSFTSITAASIALEAGAILMLGADAATIEALIEGNDGAFSAQLFITETEFSNEGVILMSSDGLAFEYTTDDLGTYSITRILPPSIPEPTTATLGLAALGLLASRRRMK